MSCSMSLAYVSRRSAGRLSVGSLSTERKTYSRPSPPANRNDLVCIDPPRFRTRNPRAVVSSRSSGTLSGVVHNAR